MINKLEISNAPVDKLMNEARNTLGSQDHNFNRTYAVEAFSIKVP